MHEDFGGQFFGRPAGFWTDNCAVLTHCARFSSERPSRRLGRPAISHVSRPRLRRQAGPTTGGDLTVSVRAEPRSFCSCVTPEATTYLVTLLTQAKLVRVNPATEDIEPWLADNWTRSDDGLRYVIKLKPNVRFSDGAPLTADDVAFSLAAAYDPASAIADSLQVLGKKLQATVMDPLTVAIAFPSPFGPGLRVLDDLPILPKHKLEGALSSGRFGAAWSVTTPVKEIVGLGPFVIADYRPGERLVFARNSHYFRTDDRGAHLPYLDRIIVEIVPDQDAQALKLEGGETDTEASEIRPEDYAPLKRAAEQGSVQLLDLGAAVDPDALWINLRPNAFERDPRRSWIQRDELRQAISAAVDRQLFADTIFLGAATPVFGPITPSNKKWYSDGSSAARARRLASETIARADRARRSKPRRVRRRLVRHTRPADAPHHERTDGARARFGCDPRGARRRLG